jgi:hypothetical protein
LLRAWELTDGDPSFHIILPEGEIGDVQRNKDGTASKIQWGSFDQIAKAFLALEKQDFETVSGVLGYQHKVRNFYNNILRPTDKVNGDVTVDTHAVAAGLLLPVAGNDAEVSFNFGSPSSAVTGASGSYGIYADAYRKAAEQRGLLPREIQSITWEAVRGLFKDTWKTPANYKIVQSLWKDYANGRKSINEVREAIFKAAGGINEPDWVRTPPKRGNLTSARPDEAGKNGADQGKLPGNQLRGPEVSANSRGRGNDPAPVPKN